ncbi:MAG: hypothetical protein ACP5NX_01015 [Candidatus Bilamarchaeaceae archaeon]
MLYDTSLSDEELIGNLRTKTNPDARDYLSRVATNQRKADGIREMAGLALCENYCLGLGRKLADVLLPYEAQQLENITIDGGYVYAVRVRACRLLADYCSGLFEIKHLERLSLNSGMPKEGREYSAGRLKEIEERLKADVKVFTPGKTYGNRPAEGRPCVIYPFKKR